MEISAAAQCHYQAGRFSQAVVEFEQCEDLFNQRCHKIVALNDARQKNNDGGYREQQNDEIILADDHPNPTTVSTKRRKRSRSNRVELIALPPLALRADLAMCRFRSVVLASSGVGESSSTGETSDNQNATIQTKSSESNGGNTSPSIENSASNLRKEAIETNRNYRQALKGAAMSLVHTCNIELQAQAQAQGQPSMMKHKKSRKSIQKAMKSTSLSILMAGVAASHLHLHHTENLNGSNGNGANRAWGVLVEAAVLAADLMRIRREWMYELYGDGDIDSKLAAGGAKSSLLEESICILNETLCNNANLNCNKNDQFDVEDERGNVAMHSFRSALKVAALSTGKLILPTVSSKKELHENIQPSKRQKVKGGVVFSPKKDAWNVMHLHSSPLLHSRDRLVDALSFHSAAIQYPQNRELFIDKREICFDEAVKWENLAGALYDDGRIETNGCAGYAWKLRNCLRGMELSSPRDGLEHDVTQKRALLSLDLLASSSSSQFACDLLGCIHAQRGEYSRAIEKFQLSMEQGERNIPDADEEISTGLAEHRTIVNMALCFFSMGDVDTPLELLLHLWMAYSDSRPSISDNDRPMALLISADSIEMDCVAKSSIQFDKCTKMQLLWKLFHASSLAQDWGTCLNAMEEMLDGNNCVQHCEKHCNAAHAFALLQCRRPTAAREITTLLTSKLALLKNIDMAQPLLIISELYNADTLLLSEKIIGMVENTACTPFICTRRALDVLHNVSGKKKEKDNEAQNSPSLQELEVIIYNDHGIALLIAGDSVGALRCFREAAKLVSSLKTSTETPPLWLILPTSFNLSLLLLRDGYMEESAKVWLHARGHLSTWQKAVGGNNEALRKLKELRVMAINRHGLLMAKRSMKAGAVILDQENIMEWVPPVVEQGDVKEDSTRVGGVDASQITAFDVVIFRCAVSFAEKKASSSFRKKTKSFGY